LSLCQWNSRARFAWWPESDNELSTAYPSRGEKLESFTSLAVPFFERALERMRTMTTPAFEKLLDELRTEKNRGGTARVIGLMKSVVEPQIARMTKQQLVEAFAEAVYAMWHMEAELYVIEDCAETVSQDRQMWKLTSGHLMQEVKTAPSKAGKKAADARHNKPGASRDLHKEIKAIWASGKFRSRDDCADEEWQAVGFGSRKVARNALLHTPDPTPWPARKNKP